MKIEATVVIVNTNVPLIIVAFNIAMADVMVDRDRDIL